MLRKRNISVLWPAIFLVLGSDSAYSDSALDETLLQLTRGQGIKALKEPQKKSPTLRRLGEKLFFEKALSGNRNVSCATCHHPDKFSVDGLPLAPHENGKEVLPRNTPALYNLGQPEITSLFWDARLEFLPWSRVFVTEEPKLNGIQPEREDFTRVLSDALSMQALFPVLNPGEMLGAPGSNELATGGDRFSVWDRLMDRLLNIPRYEKMFLDAYPEIKSARQLNFAHAAEAIAAYERTEFSAVDTPLDRFLKGHHSALTSSEKRGAIVFFSTGLCSGCHAGPALSMAATRNVAYPQIGPGIVKGDDPGRAWPTGKNFLKYQFRAPPLRNVALTGPWGHSGAFSTLEDLVEHYDDVPKSLARYQYRNSYQDRRYYLATERNHNPERLKLRDGVIGRPLGLTPREKADLVQFLKTGLTDLKFQPGRK